MMVEQAPANTPQASTPYVAPVPKVGDRAPDSDLLPFPNRNMKPTVIVFLRHCGCPFAEKTFKILTAISSRYPELRCVAVSHGSQAVTDEWVVSVGGEWEVEVLVDEMRELYGRWGLGQSSTWHVLNPWSLYATLRLGTDEGIWNRASAGSHWQLSGAFGVDSLGFVRWAHVATSADDIPDLAAAVKTLVPKRED